MKNKLNPNARKWVRALRSGKYKQTKEVLHRVTKRGKKEVHTYCCLGVACELYIESGGRLGRSSANERGAIAYAGSRTSLPPKVQKWLGLTHREGSLSDPVLGAYCLSNLNDAGKQFSAIAKVIESKPEGLFAEGK